jgi:UDPglucose 6-dehydrogenase
MKAGSDNFRDSAIIDILYFLRKSGVQVIVYEPQIDTNEVEGFPVIHSLEKFKKESEMIISNRMESQDLTDVLDKIFTRDLFQRD